MACYILREDKMRRIVTSEGTPIDIRANEIDWLPVSIGGYTHHLIVSDEDFCKTKDEKLRLRKTRRKEKYLEI
jgi:hypothetical protein